MPTFDPLPTMWSAPVAERADRPLLVLLHGHGAHEGDLFRLSPYLPLDKTIAAPRGPIELEDGYSWFDVAAPRPAPLNEAADALAAWLTEAGASASRIELLGFSQGGVVALQLLRRHPDLVSAVVVLSAIVEGETEPVDAALAALHRPVFWGRGTVDELVPPSGVEHTREWLLEHTELTERIYEQVGHWITDAELDDVNSFLRSLDGD